MNCKDVQVQLQAFLDGDLRETEHRLVLSHLKECSSCAAMKRDFELLAGMAREELSVKAPENFDRQVQQRLAACRPRGPRLWRLLPASVAWSTAVALILGLFAASNFLSTYHQQAESAYSTAIAQSKVTSVILPADPGTPGMHVFIRGEQDNMLVRVPSTVKITRSQLTQDFFLSEVSH